MPGAACGRAATSRRGFFEPASEPAEGRPIAQMTRTPIREGQRETAPFPAPSLVRTIREQTGPLGSFSAVGKSARDPIGKTLRHFRRSSLTYRNLASGGRLDCSSLPGTPTPMPPIPGRNLPRGLAASAPPRRGRFGVDRSADRTKTKPAICDGL